MAIARALVNEPLLLLADEPTGALDTGAGEETGELLRDLNAGGQTLVLVTHNPELAARYTTRTVAIVDGRIAGGWATADLDGRAAGAHGRVAGPDGRMPGPDSRAAGADGRVAGPGNRAAAGPDGRASAQPGRGAPAQVRP